MSDWPVSNFRLVSKVEAVTMNQCFGTLCGQFCSAPFDPCLWAILTLWLDLPECHCTASHQAVQAPLASFLVACLAAGVQKESIKMRCVFHCLELDHLDLLASFDPARISPAEVSEVGMITG